MFTALFALFKAKDGAVSIVKVGAVIAIVALVVSLSVAVFILKSSNAKLNQDLGQIRAEKTIVEQNYAAYRKSAEENLKIAQNSYKVEKVVETKYVEVTKYVTKYRENTVIKHVYLPREWVCAYNHSTTPADAAIARQVLREDTPAQEDYCGSGDDPNTGPISDSTALEVIAYNHKLYADLIIKYNELLDRYQSAYKASLESPQTQ